MKYFIFSIDDGTIYDKKVIDIFNKYGIKGTFNEIKQEVPHLDMTRSSRSRQDYL